MANANITADDGGGRQRSVPVDLPSNSKYRKPAGAKEKEPTEKVVTGTVVKRKRGLGGRIKDSIISEGSESVTDFVIAQVVIPSIKKLIVDSFGMIGDAFVQGIERAVYGDNRYRSRADRPGGGFVTNYAGIRRYPRAAPEYGAVTPRARSRHEFNELIFETRGEALDVLDGLRDCIDRYQQASVADFYGLAGVTSNFPDNKWGWFDLEEAEVRLVRGGYIVALPRTEPID